MKASELADLAAAAIADGEFEEAESAIGELNDSLTENFIHVGALLQLDLMLARKQNDDAAEFSKILAEDFAGNTKVLNSMAAALVSKPDANPQVQSAAAKIATPISTADGEGRRAEYTGKNRIPRRGQRRGAGFPNQGRSRRHTYGSGCREESLGGLPTRTPSVNVGNAKR